VIVGNEKITNGFQLIRKGIISCEDCTIKRRFDDFIGKKFNKLTVIEEIKREGKEGRFWKVKCDCGNEKILSTRKLKIKKSCSCHWRKPYVEPKPKKQQATPLEAVLKRIYTRYNDNDKLTKDIFYQLSQQNCYYCNNKPLAKYEYNKNFTLYYNGLDRIDQKGFHTPDNILTCCKHCNFLKMEQNYDDFLNWINRINFKQPKYYSGNETLIIKGFKQVYNSRYSDGNISYEQFCYMSQQNCFYCNNGLLNLFIKKIKYNGLDRIDSTKGHDLNNVVTSCKICNYSKNNLSLQEWHNRINNVKNHLSL